MAYAAPVVAEVLSGNQATDATSHAVALPAAVSADELLIVCMTIDGGPTITWDDVTVGPWTPILSGGSGSTVTWRILMLRCAGTEGGASLTITTSAAEQSAYVLYRISGSNGDYVIGTAGTSGTSPNPPSVTTSWLGEANLFLAGVLSDIGTRNLTTTPASYAADATSKTGTSDGVSVFTCHRSLTADTENPAAYSVTTNATSSAFTLAIRPGSRAPGVGVPAILLATDYVGSSAASHDIPMPAAVSVGDRLLMLLHQGALLTVDPTASGWSLLFTDEIASTVYHAAYWKIATGSEGGGVVSITQASSTLLLATTLRIAGAGAIEASASANRTDAVPNLAPSWGEASTLWIDALGVVNASTWSPPYNYTLANDNISGSRALYQSSRDWVMANEAPRPWVLLSGSVFRHAAIIAVQPGAPYVPPPAGSAALPTAMRLARRPTPAWSQALPRRFAPVYANVVAPADDGFISIIW